MARKTPRVVRRRRRYQRGGNFKTWIKGVGQKIGTAAKSVGKFVKKHKLLSKGLKIAALVAPEFAPELTLASKGADLVGLGHPRRLDFIVRRPKRHYVKAKTNRYHKR